MKKMIFVAGVVGCLSVASNVLADLAPPPKPLHRIGYEIFGPKKTETPKELEVKQDPEILRLTKEIEEAQRGNDDAKTERLLKEMVDRLMKIDGLGGKFSDSGFLGGGWKMPQDLTKTERNEFAARIKDIQMELQKAFDAEHATLLAAGKLKRVVLFDGGYEYRYERYLRETQAENARMVVETIMEKNVEMRQKCMGIPIELLTNAMSCPKPSIDSESVKLRFRTWAESRMKGLSGVCRHIVFGWQYFCCVHEKRPWFDEFQKSEGGHRGAMRTHRRFGGVMEWADETSARTDKPRKGFEDFDGADEGVAFALKWYDKAVSYGFVPKKYETILVERMKAKEDCSASASGIAVEENAQTHITGHTFGKSGSLSPVKVRISGRVSNWELAVAYGYCRDALSEKDYLDDFDEIEFRAVDSGTLDRACRVFGKMRPRNVKITSARVSNGELTGLDLSGLDRFSCIGDLKLLGLRVTGAPSFAKFEFMRRFHAENCQFDNQDFLKGFGGKFAGLGFWDCTVGNTEALGDVKEVSAIGFRNAKDPVDLAFFKKAKGVQDLDVSGCKILHADALRGNATLKRLNIKGTKGEVDWIGIVQTCPTLESVEYDDADVPESRRLEFKRILRRKAGGNRLNNRQNLDLELQDAVWDRDADEIKRLISAGASAQKVWNGILDGYLCGLQSSHQVSLGSMEPSVLKILLDGGADAKSKSPRSGSGALWIVCANGDKGTNRVAVLKLLLERGCDPNAQEGGFKKTPLDGVIPHGAVGQTHLEMVKLLLDHGADPKLMVDGMDRLSGDWGGSDGVIRAEIARLLKAHGADMTKMMSDLKQLGNDPPMLLAALDGGADANRRNDKGELLLHEMFADKFMMQKWVESGLETLLQKLEGRGAKMKEALNGVSVYELMGGRLDGNAIAIAKVWIEHGADVNAVDFFGETLLEKCISDDRALDVAFIGYLLEHGADPNVKMRHGSIIGKALADPFERKGTNRLVIVELLLKHGADANAADRFGKTTLLGDLVADRKCDIALVELLLKHGADPNRPQGNNGETPVETALRWHCSQSVIDLLIKHGGKMPEGGQNRSTHRERMEGRRGRASDARMPDQDPIRREIERHMREMRELHQNNGPGEPFDHERMRQLQEEHRKRMKELRECAHSGV